MFVENEGVAMGASFSLTITNIFMAHLQTTLMDRLLQFYRCERYQCKDDIFALINANTKVDDIFCICNNFYSFIKSDHKTENRNRLTFPNVQSIQPFEHKILQTKIYDKNQDSSDSLETGILMYF